MLRGMSREETTRRAGDLLNAFDLVSGAANTMVTDYSAGMTKKICLASAMIHSPRILVLDEPFESVDPVSSANLKDILTEYAYTGGTVIISSHVMSLVEKMCTHVAVINDGQVRAAGTIDRCRPARTLKSGSCSWSAAGMPRPSCRGSTADRRRTASPLPIRLRPPPRSIARGVMMEVALIMVRLRWTLTLATLRKSAWQTVAYVFSASYSASAPLSESALSRGSSAAALIRYGGSSHPCGVDVSGLHVAVLVGATMTIFIGFIQLMMLGEGSTMNPRKFAIYGIADRNLQFGLLLSGLSGIPSLTGVASLMLWTLAYRHMGHGRHQFPPRRSAGRHHHDEHLQTGHRPIHHAGDQQTRQRRVLHLHRADFRHHLPVAEHSGQLRHSLQPQHGSGAWPTAIAAWTPFGAAFQLPFDLLTGNPLLFAAHRDPCRHMDRLLRRMSWCLSHERVTAGAQERPRGPPGIGAFGWMPDGSPARCPHV